jgi:hypothetical protein
MKSDIDIKLDVYKIVKASELASTVTGKVSQTKRPNNSDKEDIIVSVLDNQNGQIQESFVNVNIYVKDNIRDNQAEENSSRLQTLCRLAAELFEVQSGEDFRFTLDKQVVLPVDGKDEHFINNRLLYQQLNF